MRELSLEELLLELVRIPSPSGEEGAVARFAADWLASQGLEVELVGASVLARLARAGAPRLMLNSHLDTVPAGEGWERDPWDVAWEGEKLTALGANDAKASAAAMMWAAARLARGAKLEGELWLALNACEETTNAGMRDVLARTGLPDAAVTGEPTGLEVVRAQGGLAVLVATWTGRSCHAAHVARVPHQNALLEAARELAGLRSPFVLEGEHPLLGPSTIAVTVLHAGDRHNRIPDRAEALFDARLAPPHTAAECAALLSAALPSAQLAVRSERLRPVETADRHPFVRAALAAAEKSAAIGSSTLSDMALLPGVPAVKCGPGVSARSHTPNEWIEARELAAGARFYEHVVPAAFGALRAEALSR